jgi:hypothetical protein
MGREINQNRRRFLASAAATIGGLELSMFGLTKSLFGGKPPLDSPLVALGRATAWVNSASLTANDLRGKTVVVNFCTYTCINWLRSLPYVRAWAEKYRDQGLVVIGAHTPEFGFEKDLDNVRRACNDLRVEYPVAVDNDYAIWNGFENQYWPALYFLDAKGALRDRHFGEGGYDEAERTIQRLLVEAGAKDVKRGRVKLEPQGIEAPADWRSLASPENYLGSDRTEGFVTGRGRATARGHEYAAPTRLQSNEWALTGDWSVGRQAVALNQPGGRILSRFHARDLHLVMAPATRGASVRFRVRIDGQAPDLGHGGDVDVLGEGHAREQRLYQLIRQTRPITERLFEIEFLDAGIEAYAFTFG